MVTVSGSESSTIPPGTASGTTIATTGATMRLIPKPTLPCTNAPTATIARHERELGSRDVHGRESGSRRRLDAENARAT